MPFYKVLLEPGEGEISRPVWIPIKAKDQTHAIEIATTRCTNTKFTANQGTIIEITQQEYNQMMGLRRE